MQENTTQELTSASSPVQKVDTTSQVDLSSLEYESQSITINITSTNVQIFKHMQQW